MPRAAPGRVLQDILGQILDLLEAQVSLSTAESGLVQARYAALLARAGLEVIIGRRLTNGQDTQ